MTPKEKEIIENLIKSCDMMKYPLNDSQIIAIQKAIQQTKSKLREDIEKKELKILNDINWDLTILVNNLRDDLKLDTQHREEGYKNKEHSYNAIKRFTEKIVYRICNKWKLKREELLKSLDNQTELNSEELEQIPSKSDGSPKGEKQ